MSFKQQLIKINACKEAIDWVENRTIEQAWNDCHRGDWMLLLLELMKEKEGWLNEKEIMLLGCWCARRALKCIPEGEDRPLKAIEAKEKWTRGEITKEEMNAAREVAAKAATDYATKAAAWSAAWSAAKASAWSSAWFSAWGAARDKKSLNQANYIRTQFTPPV